jgi:hypothetical protein
MKKAIVGILNNPATSLNSHSAGMVHIVSELFEATVLNERDDWNEYDMLIVYHGTNFKPGSYNMIGGMSPEVIIRADKLKNFNGEKYTLDGFQLKDFSIKRKINMYDDVADMPIIELPKRNNLVIGDSHSLSVWPSANYEISRNDGKTLHGFLKLNMDLSAYEHIIMYFGNIDLRFHLARQNNPIEATKDLFNRYCEYASRYNSTITQLLAIEDESRRIPKSGQYKGVNFFGSIELRKELRLVANQIMFESGIPMLEWPTEFLDSNGNLSFNVMEPKQSVHIRPAYYLKNVPKQLTLF